MSVNIQSVIDNTTWYIAIEVINSVGRDRTEFTNLTEFLSKNKFIPINYQCSLYLVRSGIYPQNNQPEPSTSSVTVTISLTTTKGGQYFIIIFIILLDYFISCSYSCFIFQYYWFFFSVYSTNY